MFVDLINAPARRQVDDSLAAAKSKSALLQRLEGLPEDEQQEMLLDLVRSHIATVLGNTTAEAIDPDKAFQELGFDSLTAVEMRNRLKAATGLALSPTLIFDYPNSAALAGYFHQELVGASAEAAPKAAPGEEEIQRVVASIPVKRLRQAGVLGTAAQPGQRGRGCRRGYEQGKRPRDNGSRRSGQCRVPRRRRLVR